MNENRVLKVEKRVTNRFGLVILVLFVIAGIGFGTYYLIKNKDNLSFYLPWEKNDDSDTREVKGLKSNKEEKFERIESEIEAPVVISHDNSFIEVKLDSVKYDKTDYIFNLTFTDNDFLNFNVEITDILIDDFSTRITNKFDLSSFSSKNYEFTITKDMLDLYRINTFETISIKAIITGIDSKDTYTENWVIRSTTIKASFPKTIQQILEIDGIKFYYYKVAESKDNYFIYLLLENTTTRDINYYYSKFVLDDEELDASSYASVIYGKTKYVETIKVPKKDFSRIKDLTIKIMTMKDKDILLSKDVKVSL